MAQFSGTSVFVTGATGFIGSHLVARLLAHGAGVHVLVRPESDLARLAAVQEQLHLHQGTLCDVASLHKSLEEAKPNIICHLAGNTEVRRLDATLRQLDESVQVNLQGTLNLMQAAHGSKTPVERLIRMGGLEEYGRGAVPYAETQREQPVSPYSASQVAATQYCQMLQPYLAFDLVTLRLALVYGPAQSENFFIPSLIAHSLQGKDFEMTSGEQGRDLLYVDDVVEAVLHAMVASEVAGEVINISAGREYSIRHVAETILNITGSDIHLNVGVAQPRPSEIHHLLGSNAKARRLLSWSPTTSLHEGLCQTVAWYRKHIGEL